MTVYLSRLLLDLRSRGVRRDLADCYAMHRTLMSAFGSAPEAIPAREHHGVLYRVEVPEPRFCPVLVQSKSAPVWSELPGRYLTDHPEAAATKEITGSLQGLVRGMTLRFRLRANATKRSTRNRSTASAATGGAWSSPTRPRGSPGSNARPRLEDSSSSGSRRRSTSRSSVTSASQNTRSQTCHRCDDVWRYLLRGIVARDGPRCLHPHPRRGDRTGQGVRVRTSLDRQAVGRGPSDSRPPAVAAVCGWLDVPLRRPRGGGLGAQRPRGRE